MKVCQITLCICVCSQMRCKGSMFFLFYQKKKEKVWKNKREKAKKTLFWGKISQKTSKTSCIFCIHYNKKTLFLPQVAHIHTYTRAYICTHFCGVCYGNICRRAFLAVFSPNLRFIAYGRTFLPLHTFERKIRAFLSVFVCVQK